MMARLLPVLAKAAEGVAAGMLAAIFATFILQIVARYIFGWSLGWTIELSLSLWLWLVLFTCAFVLRERDHVKFDVLVTSLRPGARRICALLASISIFAALLASVPDSWDYVTFYKIKKSAVFRIPLIWVFSIYIIFLVAVIARYGWRIAAILRGYNPDLDQRDIMAD
ncbi:TRAP transporter small permease [Fuscovulum ytuae]|uniref:TRAP transporter small permease protein n=1 Tax=Fuscovulum ytuae TaxID=3042299 RepID=A0ABY8Q337_9RHOB|nr:TRAP transporter small permease subunit [Fuscovulum sp. YMD61]WGV15022.1 TRAP transporter small permease subunit [Fuscovulum sp. YMD61]